MGGVRISLLDTHSLNVIIKVIGTGDALASYSLEDAAGESSGLAAH